MLGNQSYCTSERRRKTWYEIETADRIITWQRDLWSMSLKSWFLFSPLKWQKYFYNSSQSHVNIIFLIRENSQNFEFEWNFSHLMRERWQELEAGDMKFGYHGFSLVEREVVHYHSQVMALASLASTKKTCEVCSLICTNYTKNSTFFNTALCSKAEIITQGRFHELTHVNQCFFLRI